MQDYSFNRTSKHCTDRGNCLGRWQLGIFFLWAGADKVHMRSTFSRSNSYCRGVFAARITCLHVVFSSMGLRSELVVIATVPFYCHGTFRWTLSSSTLSKVIYLYLVVYESLRAFVCGSIWLIESRGCFCSEPLVCWRFYVFDAIACSGTCILWGRGMSNSWQGVCCAFAGDPRSPSSRPSMKCYVPSAT